MRNLFFLAGMQDKRKSPPCQRVAGFGARFRAAEPAHRVCAHTPEDGDFSGLGFLRFAVLGLVLRADELSVNQDMVL